jgi:Protein of unknown function (DUF3562)
MRHLVYKGNQRVSAPTSRAAWSQHGYQFHGGVSMSSLLEVTKEVVRRERAMSSLCDRTGTPLAEVRRLFAQEFSRPELGAKVRSYLTVLTASTVRTMLRRKDA